MLDWLAQNGGTIFALAVLTVIVILIVKKLIKDRKNGKSSCGCGCEKCAMYGSCHQKKEQ